MSVLFGIWNFDKKPIRFELIGAADAMLAPYAPDGCCHYNRENITLAHHAFHTTPESRHEIEPFISASGAVVTWDGRLDNREELVREFRDTLTNQSTDLEIAAAAFDGWDTACFAKLLGDWAVAIWDERGQRVILARDFAGIRPLYYLVQDGQAQWSSVLDPLVTLSNTQFALNEEYVAGWLALYPSAETTPYVGIRAVPPCSFVTVTSSQVSVAKFWDFDPGKKITYRTDAEYEEHFRFAFEGAVRRRLRSDGPICAELSGGMDSPSITCMADLIACSAAGIPEIYTLSYYNDSEPHGDERPYFAKVEEKRGRRGCHIDLAGTATFNVDSTASLWLTPASVSEQSNTAHQQRLHFLQSHGIRVVLSGTGGDEMTGGVPTPTPELQDLIIQRDLRELAHRLKLWALAKRKPWLRLFADALRGFLPSRLHSQSAIYRQTQWLTTDFVSRTNYLQHGLNPRITVRRPLPSLQINLSALETLRRQMSINELTRGVHTETRYPFLDRTLLEFLFAIPREQVIRPGYRRSLMRRALAGIVPPEVLERRRKAYASRGPRLAISSEAYRKFGLAEGMEAARRGIVDEYVFREALLAAKDDDDVPAVNLSRTLALEAWLRNVQRHRILACGETSGLQQSRRFALTPASRVS